MSIVATLSVLLIIENQGEKTTHVFSKSNVQSAVH